MWWADHSGVSGSNNQPSIPYFCLFCGQEKTSKKTIKNSQESVFSTQWLGHIKYIRQPTLKKNSSSERESSELVVVIED